MNIKVTRKPKDIQITGQKDPRGPDNTLRVWICEKGKLHLRLKKPTLRCYAFEELIENADFIEIVQK